MVGVLVAVISLVGWWVLVIVGSGAEAVVWQAAINNRISKIKNIIVLVFIQTPTASDFQGFTPDINDYTFFPQSHNEIIPAS
jgi:hypothetical protein